MARKLFGIGSRGGIVGEIQRALASAGFDPKGIDQFYGQDTAAAVESFQQAKGLPSTGIIDDLTWQALMGQPIPGTSERSLELTATFEGHGYSLAIGNVDGAWLTWGIIGFTMKYGLVQRIVLNIHGRKPELIDQAFGDKANELVRIMEAAPEEQEQWANSVSVEGRLAEPWRTGFDWLGRFSEVREEQSRVAHDEYFVPSLAVARNFGLKSELGAALCFDIQVQNGGIKATARALIKKAVAEQSPQSERDVRRIIANSVADVARAAYREDVRRRKLTIANAEGNVHGHSFVLENWGLSEAPASELS